MSNRSNPPGLQDLLSRLESRRRNDPRDSLFRLAVRLPLDVSRFAMGTYSWRMVTVSGAGNLLTVWTPEQTVTLQ